MASKKTALVSVDMSGSTCRIFENLGYGCVRLPGFEALDVPVCSHPDMLFSYLPDRKMLCDGAYYQKNKALLDGIGAALLLSERTLKKEYPNDVLFDALWFDGCVYGRIDALAPEIISLAKKTVNVKQGYALCSTLVTDKCAITADEGIFEALKKNRVDVLKINAEGVRLKGYGCGFIGGASAFDPCSNTVVFFGNVTEHSSYNEIVRFLSEYGHTVCFDGSYPLTDLGGAKLIY